MLRNKGLVAEGRRGSWEQTGQWPKGSAEAEDHRSELLSACMVVWFFSGCKYRVTDVTLGPTKAGGWQSNYEGRTRWHRS